MFLRKDATVNNDLRPSGSEIALADWDVLSTFWHPVARETDVTDSPYACRLLDVDLVVFRETNGYAAVIDRCPHRNVRLSAGTVDDGQIVCAYHGLRFDGTGQCVRVPGLKGEAPIPETYCVRAFRAQQHYGLIWVCLDDESERRIPSLPLLEDVPASGWLHMDPQDWPVSCPRHIENFVDLGHIPLIHKVTVGGDLDAPLRGRVQNDDAGLTLTTDYVEQPVGGESRPCKYTYHVRLPFAVDLAVVDETGHSIGVTDVSTPMSAYECRVFQILTQENGVDEDHRAWIEMMEALNAEDIKLLSSLDAQALPLDKKHEIHLPCDNVAHAYRQRLVELGLGA